MLHRRPPLCKLKMSEKIQISRFGVIDMSEGGSVAVQSIGTCHRSAILSKARREVKKKLQK